MNQTLKERIKFLDRKKICCGCLQPVEGEHNAKSRKKRLSCIICKERHPTALHGYIPKNKNSLVMEINHKMVKMKLKVTSLLMSNVPAH